MEFSEHKLKQSIDELNEAYNSGNYKLVRTISRRIYGDLAILSQKDVVPKPKKVKNGYNIGYNDGWDDRDHGRQNKVTREYPDLNIKNIKYPKDDMQELYDSGKSINDIVKIYGASAKILNKFIKVRTLSEIGKLTSIRLKGTRGYTTTDIENWQKDYDTGLSVYDVAKKYNKSHTTIWSNIKTRNKAEATTRRYNVKDVNKIEFENLYLSGWTRNQLVDYYKISIYSVNKILKERNINPRDIKHDNAIDRFIEQCNKEEPPNISKEWIDSKVPIFQEDNIPSKVDSSNIKDMPKYLQDEYTQKWKEAEDLLKDHKTIYLDELEFRYSYKGDCDAGKCLPGHGGYKPYYMSYDWKGYIEEHNIDLDEFAKRTLKWKNSKRKVWKRKILK